MAKPRSFTPCNTPWLICTVGLGVDAAWIDTDMDEQMTSKNAKNHSRNSITLTPVPKASGMPMWSPPRLRQKRKFRHHLRHGENGGYRKSPQPVDNPPRLYCSIHRQKVYRCDRETQARPALRKWYARLVATQG